MLFNFINLQVFGIKNIPELNTNEEIHVQSASQIIIETKLILKHFVF